MLGIIRLCKSVAFSLQEHVGKSNQIIANKITFVWWNQGWQSFMNYHAQGGHDYLVTVNNVCCHVLFLWLWFGRFTTQYVYFTLWVTYKLCCVSSFVNKDSESRRKCCIWCRVQTWWIVLLILNVKNVQITLT